MAIPGIYGSAEQRILFHDYEQKTALRMANVTLVLHTMDGYLTGTENTFRRFGPTGIRSHFGLGGPWDGLANDGELWQWEYMIYRAPAQWDANPFAVSIETSDGHRDPTPEWSRNQVATLVKFGADWARWCGKNELRICGSPQGEYGTIGWHSLFTSWNQNVHACPGPARVAQIREVIIPSVNAILRGDNTDVANTRDELLEAAHAAMQKWATERHDDKPAATLREVLDGYPALVKEVKQIDGKLDRLVSLMEQMRPTS